MTYLMGQIFVLALGVSLLSFGLGWLVKGLSAKKEDGERMDTKKDATNSTQAAVEKVGDSVREQLSEQFNRQSSQIQNHIRELQQILSAKWPSQAPTGYGTEAQARVQQIHATNPPVFNPASPSPEAKRLLEEQIVHLEKKYELLQGQFQHALRDIEGKIRENLQQIDQRVGAWYTPVLRQLGEIKELVSTRLGGPNSGIGEANGTDASKGNPSREERARLLKMAWGKVAAAKDADSQGTEEEVELARTPEETSFSQEEETDGDNLRALYGVGPYVEKVFRETFNITTYKQIAELTPKQIREIEKCLFFKEPFDRHNWVDQAQKLYDAKRKSA